MADRSNVKAADVRELVGQLQQQSLKLFEAAYKKMAEKNSSTTEKTENTSEKNENSGEKSS